MHELAQTEMAWKSELVFIPLPAAGHLFSALQLAELLVSRNAELLIRILVFKDPSINNSSIIQSQTTQAIQFIEVAQQPEPQNGIQPDNFFSLMKFVGNHLPQVRDVVAQIMVRGNNMVGFVLDMFTLEMMDVANEFHLPTYLFFTSSAASFGLWTHLDSLGDLSECRDSEKLFSIPTYKSPVPGKIFPSPVFIKEALAFLLKVRSRMMETKGIMINTFLDLEPFALEYLSDAGAGKMPPVYPVGPVINFNGVNTDPGETEVLMNWLHDQPASSVIFLCFGSSGYIHGEQVKEVAKAIEQSGCRFLWSLRKAPAKHHPGSDSEFHEQVLPEGFLQRTSGVGKVIGWAPQVQVLGHPSVGGFVTHCGWNSTLESVWFGVPMAAWPMYAEQQMNALEMVKDIGMAVEIKIDYTIDPLSKKQTVKADEIESGIRKLMEPGNERREKVKELMAKSRLAVAEFGSSYVALDTFLADMHASDRD